MSEEEQLVCTHNAANPLLDIIFLHGLTGDAKATWVCTDTNEFWPQWLTEEKDTISTYTLGYPAALFEKWAAKEMDMFERAGNVLERFAGLGIGQRPIAFVAHSLGGLLTKILLRKSREAEDEDWRKISRNTKLVIFLSTPHRGASLANALSVLPKSSKHIKLIADEAGFLNDLNQHYRGFANRSEHLRTVVYYEKHRTKRLAVVVDAASADPGVAGTEPVPFDKDHINICKPSSRTDAVYLGIRRHIHKALQREELGTTDSALATTAQDISLSEVGLGSRFGDQSQNESSAGEEQRAARFVKEDSDNLRLSDATKNANQDFTLVIPNFLSEKKQQPYIERPDYNSELRDIIYDSRVRIGHIHGFGGSGKTSLVLRCIKNEIENDLKSYYRGVFWFSVDIDSRFTDFIEEVENWFTDQNLLAAESIEESLLERVIQAIISHSVLIIVDNFERLLNLKDVNSARLKDPIAFEFFHRLDIATSRSKVLTLSRAKYDGFRSSQFKNSIEVGPLSAEQARSFLGSYSFREQQAISLANAVGFHPLALSLAAQAQARSREDFTTSKLYSDVGSVLDRYDEIFDDGDLETCVFVSLFRQPRTLDFLEAASYSMETYPEPRTFMATVGSMFAEKIFRLQSLGLVEFRNNRVSLHPIVSEYYQGRASEFGEDNLILAHRSIALAFKTAADRQAETEYSLEFKSSASFLLRFEEVYHLCRAGQLGRRKSFGEAIDVIRSDIDDWEKYNLTGKLGAWSTRTDLLAGFFTGRDFTKSLERIAPSSQSLILNEAGQCHMHMGSYEVAESLLLRKIDVDRAVKKYGYAAIGCRNASDLHYFRGSLDDAIYWMNEAVVLAKQQSISEHVAGACFGLGALMSMAGKAKAEEYFDYALERIHGATLTADAESVLGLRELRYAEYLLVHGRYEEAEEISGAYARIFGQEQRYADLALALRIHAECLLVMRKEAEPNFNEALRCARKCDELYVLVECELAWGRSQLRQGNSEEAEDILRLAEARCDSLSFGIQRLYCMMLRALILNGKGQREESRAQIASSRKSAADLGYVWFDRHLAMAGLI